MRLATLGRALRRVGGLALEALPAVPWFGDAVAGPAKKVVEVNGVSFS